jgi:hypothetical protein
VTLLCGVALAMPAASEAARWTPQVFSAPHAAGTSLSAVSCVSVHLCIAAGEFTFHSGADAVLIARWDGADWALERLTRPSGSEGPIVLGVSCPTAAACMVVGRIFIKHQLRPFAERWDGARWSQDNIPLPRGYVAGELLGVACSSATACIAVGDDNRGGPNRFQLVERWNGRRWAAQHASAGPGTVLDGTACTSSRSCIAVGDRTVVSPGGLVCQSAYAIGPSVATWPQRTVDATPLTPQDCENTFPALNAVACTGPDACTAVGGDVGSGGGASATAFRWNGLAWSRQRPASPKLGGGFTAVSCPTVTMCAAVGIDDDQTAPIAETWRHHVWSAQKLNFGRVLTGVSCPSARLCVAVGDTGHSMLAAILRT